MWIVIILLIIGLFLFVQSTKEKELKQNLNDKKYLESYLRNLIEEEYQTRLKVNSHYKEIGIDKCDLFAPSINNTEFVKKFLTKNPIRVLCNCEVELEVECENEDYDIDPMDQERVKKNISELFV